MIFMSTSGTYASHSRTIPDEFIRYIFCTLTFARADDSSKGSGLYDAWMATPRLWNIYIQRIRRLHGFRVGYLRTVEAHEDLYPHIHCVLDFGSAKIRVNNGKFFDKNLYSAWKAQWTRGLSDYQRPYSGRESGALLYIIKYISKNTTKKTIWRKVFTHANAKMRDAPRSSDLPIQTKSIASPAKNTVVKDTANIPTLDNPSSFFCKQFKIKQCTWSRNFVFPTLRPKSLLVAQSLLTPSTN